MAWLLEKRPDLEGNRGRETISSLLGTGDLSSNSYIWISCVIEFNTIMISGKDGDWGV